MERIRSRSNESQRVIATLLAVAILVGLVGNAPAQASDVVRVAGDSRVNTAVAVSSYGWARADTVVVARADDPADALSGSALAGRLGAPLLITPSTVLADDVAAEVGRLGARTAYVLGGEAALSTAVVAGLRSAGVAEVVRLAGKDRYETAAAVARHLDVAPGGTALVVGGWPDALGVSGLAARRAAAGEPWPVLVVNNNVPKATSEALDELRPARILVIGGDAAVPSQIDDALGRKGYTVERVAGATRYETSLQVASLSIGSGPLVLATGADFPDGLAAGPFAAIVDGTLLLVPPLTPDPVQLEGVAGFDGATGVVVVGGSAAVSDEVASAIAAVIPAASDVDTSGSTTDPSPEPTSEPSPTSEPTSEPSPEPEPSPVPEPEPTPDGDGWVMPDLVSPTGLPTYVADVVIAPGTDLQAVVDARPAGTTYLLASGVHRLARVRPKPGDTFVGQPGTILSGARDISSSLVTWRAASGAWYVEGQTQSSSPYGTIDSGGDPWHAYGNELFVDDARWQRVGSVAELAPGRWFLDDDADRIWIGTDPTTLDRIEASAVDYAFDGPNVDGVTIDNLTVEKYANRSSHGAINAINTANWTIRRVTARWNHGAGVSTGPGSVLEYSRMHHNGQLGVKGVGTFRWGPREGQSLPVTVRHNEIAHNGVLDYKWSWEAGATKFAEHASGILFEQNWVHHNDGPGPWFDVYNHDAVIRSNLVEHNAEKGIFYEISYGAVIYDNVVRYNGVGKSPVINAAGIYVSSSTDVEVFHNLVYGNPSGVVARSAGDRNPRVSNLHVHHNDVEITEGRNGMNIDQGETTAAYFERGNRFEANTYRLDSFTQRRFFWGDDSAKTTSQWIGYGQDVDGLFLLELGVGDLPAASVSFVPTVYGAGATL